jgi:hypothetical protein
VGLIKELRVRQSNYGASNIRVTGTALIINHCPQGRVIVSLGSALQSQGKLRLEAKASAATDLETV